MVSALDCGAEVQGLNLATAKKIKYLFPAICLSQDSHVKRPRRKLMQWSKSNTLKVFFLSRGPKMFKMMKILGSMVLFLWLPTCYQWQVGKKSMKCFMKKKIDEMMIRAMEGNETSTC